MGQLIAADEMAERALLGSALQWPDRCASVLTAVAPEDFFIPKHGDLAAVIGGMVRRGQGVDLISVAGQVEAQGLSDWDAVGLFDLTQAAMMPEMAQEHAARVSELSGRRRLLKGAQRAVQRLETASLLADSDVRTITGELRAACDDAEEVATDRTRPVPKGMSEFLSERDSHDWLVPGLLERMDRIVLTGAEGSGKSVLTSQIAACLAGGVHPFSGSVLGAGDRGVRVLVLDCENSPSQSRRRFRRVIQRVDFVREGNGFPPVDWGERLKIDLRPAGVDLLSSRDVSWVEHAITATAPDLLVMGPLYKLHHLDENDNSAAREVAWVLDGLRERHGVALLTEAHAGKAKDSQGRRTIAPVGASVWLRWPEFGFGLSPSQDGEPDKSGRSRQMDFLPWRGAREERAFPTAITWGHTLPWIAVDYDENEVSSDL